MALQYKDWYGTQYWSEREGNAIQYIVIHDTEGPRDAAFAWWASPDNPYQSSAHDLIDSAGVVWHCVPYDKAAHHAGGSHFPGYNELDPATGRYEPNANLVSIGIELEYPAAPASPAWPAAQIDAAVELVKLLAKTYNIPRANVYRHADIDPQNRSDPRNFDWEGFLQRVYPATNNSLDQAVRNAAWNAGGIAYNPDAAFPTYARTHNLGNPETPEFDFTSGGEQFRGQGFSKVIIYARVGVWNDIREVNW
jgi:N-acetyl-anhydromuramyl-L-alanine amidase AmpD